MALLAIALFKLLKAAILVGVAVGAFRVIHGGMQETVQAWALHLHADPHNRVLNAVLSRLLNIDEHKLRLLQVAMFIYGALYAVEGVGLLLGRRWAEWLTVVSTAGFVPVEVYELFRRPGPMRAVLLVVNVAIVVYLVRRLRNDRRPRGAQTGAGE
jgi:uncharacterized membrane protein (DUF2068 family)